MPASSVVLDHIDALTYLHVRKETEIAAAEEQEGDDLLLPVLHQDVWATAYLPEPELAPEVPPRLAVERRLVEKLLANPAWEAAREQTTLDEWLSATLTVPTSAKLLALLPEEAKALAREAALREQKARELEEQSSRLREQAKHKENPALQDDLVTQAEAAERAAEAEQQTAHKVAGEAVAVLDAAGEKLEKALARAAFEAAEKARSTQETVDVCRGWSTEPGKPHAGVPGKEVLVVARKLEGNKHLQEIVRISGRFTRIAFQKRRSKIKREPTEISAIETGNSLSRTLPSELANLADPVRKWDFYHRFAEGRLLQYRLDARTPQGKGPMVVCVDESSSMAGDKEVWAKGVAMACFNLAAKENRAYALIHFGSSYEIRVDRFHKPRKVGPGELLDAIEHFFAGGTDFETPLSRAMEIMEESEYRNGDVIFITDAICWVSPSFLKKFNKSKQEKGFSVFAVLVEKGMEKAVQPFADRIALALPGKNDLEILKKIAAPA